MQTKVKYKSKPPVIIKACQDAAEVIGNRIGAYIMSTARKSLKAKQTKKGEQESKPGEPPRATPFFKSTIRFGYSKQTRSVVIGPMLLSGRASKDAPEALEQGKGTTRIVPMREGKKVRRRRVRARYEARPFMGPAFKKRIGELPSLWRDAIRE